jgi:hypothetical protein
VGVGAVGLFDIPICGTWRETMSAFSIPFLHLFWYSNGVKFEFDPAKSEANREKHGIDFDSAKELWLGKLVELSARDKGEARSLIIGKIGKTFWSAIVTTREGIIRIISVRRLRDEEKKLYQIE